MRTSILKPYCLRNLNENPSIRKYAVIKRPMDVFIDVYFIDILSNSTKKNEYALSYIGPDVDVFANCDLVTDLNQKWKFEVLNESASTINLFRLGKDNDCLYLCADAALVESIVLHSIDPGKPIGIKCLENVSIEATSTSSFSEDNFLSPTTINSYSSEMEFCKLATETVYSDSIVFHVILHEGCSTKMTFISKNDSTGLHFYYINVGIFNIKYCPGSYGNSDFPLSVTTHNSSSERLSLTDTWFVSQIFNENPTYYKVEAISYCEFDVVVNRKSDINRVLPPAVYSFWEISQLATLSLHTLSVRGHVNRIANTNNSCDCPKEQGCQSGNCGDTNCVNRMCNIFQPVTVKIPSRFLSIGTCDGLRLLTSGSNNPYEFRITSNFAQAVPGESLVFNLDDNSSTVGVLNLTHFVIKGNYKYPLYGVKCNVSKLSNSTNLEELTVNYASIYGNISSLSNLTKLRIIQLMNCHVTGDIDAFRNNLSLTELTAPLHEISGDLSSLSNLTQLSKLDLTDSRVTGDIADLNDKTNLSELITPLQGITGSLSSLSGLTKLAKIDLNGSQVTGDINYLTNLHKLTTINLNRCNVEGDLSKLPVSCTEFRAIVKSATVSTSFTWTDTNPRYNRTVTINNTTLHAKAISIPNEIVMDSSDDIKNMLNDISQSESISNGSIMVRVNNLSDNEFQNLKSFCQGKLAALGLVGINALVLNGQTITNNN